MDDLDDIELVRRFQTGDRDAFGEIVRRYQDRIHNLCAHLLGNLAEAPDLSQETFLKAYRHLGRFQPRASLYTWLYRIAVNACIDRRRRPFFDTLFRRGEAITELMTEPEAPLPGPEQHLENRRLADALHRALGQLSPKLRTVIVLKELEGMAYDEIAVTLKISIGTVKSRLSRAREEMRRALKEFREPER